MSKHRLRVVVGTLAVCAAWSLGLAWWLGYRPLREAAERLLSRGHAEVIDLTQEGIECPAVDEP